MQLCVLRNRHAAMKKTIPIPYETHFLCIQETLSKKGWKAYWYRKCRCARARGRLAKTSSATAHPSTCANQSLNQSSTTTPPSVKNDISPPAAENATGQDRRHNEAFVETLKLGCSGSDEEHISFAKTNDRREEFPPACAAGPARSDRSTGVRVNFQCVASEEMTRRKEKVASAAAAILPASTGSHDVIRSGLLRPIVFPQSYEAVDKQPTCLNLIKVRAEHFKHVAAFEGLMNADNSRQKRVEALLTRSPKPSNGVGTRVRAGQDSDLRAVWAYGKHKSFFEVKKAKNFTKLLARRRMLKRAAVKTKALGIRRRLVGLKRKAVIQARLPQRIQKSKPRPANAVFNRTLDLSIWKVPKKSFSTVVSNLESKWEAELDLVASCQLSRCDYSQPYGAITLTTDQIALALTALPKNSEIFTFSSKRVRAKKGQKNILLISRKYFDEPRRRFSYRETSESETPLSDTVEVSDEKPAANQAHGPEVDIEKSSGVSTNPSKILLKLKKVYTSNNPDQVLYTTNDVETCRPDAGFCDEQTAATPQEVATPGNDDKEADSEISPAVTETAGPHPAEDLNLPETHLIDEDDTVVGANEVILPPDLPETDMPVVERSDLEVEPESERHSLITTTDGCCKTYGDDKAESARDDESVYCSSLATAGEDTTSGDDINDYCRRRRVFSHDWRTPPTSPVRVEKLESFPRPDSPLAFRYDPAILDDSTPQKDGRSFVPLPTPVKTDSVADAEQEEQATPSIRDEDQDVEYKIRDWDREISAGQLEQFLSGVNERSLDFLELVLLSLEPKCLPPLEFLISMQNSEAKNRSDPVVCDDSCSDSSDDDRDLLPQINSFCGSDLRWLPQSFESPETVRGISQSTMNDAKVAPLSPTDSSRDFQGSPVSPNGPERPNGHARLNAHHKVLEPNPIIKACNVVIEPLVTISKEHSGSVIDANSLKVGYGDFCSLSSENLHTTHKKMLKSNALNGAYWKIPSVSERKDVAVADGTTQWFLRDRTKRPETEEKPEVERSPETAQNEDDMTSVESSEHETEPGIYWLHIVYFAKSVIL